MEHSPVVANYLGHVDRRDRTPREEEVALVERARRREPGAADELLRRHLAFVIRAAMEFRGRGVPFEDLIGEGCVGFLKAIRRFDPSNGTRFMTYAGFWVRKAIFDALADQPRTVRVPRYQRAQGRAIPRELRLDDPIDSEVARTFGEALADPRAPRPADDLIAREVVAKVRREVLALSTREQAILASRFGLDREPAMTLREVAARLAISRERVRQLESAALARLRRALSAPPSRNGV